MAWVVIVRIARNKLFCERIHHRPRTRPPPLMNAQWLRKERVIHSSPHREESTRSNGGIIRAREGVVSQTECSKWLRAVASIPLSWRTCLRRGGTARPRRWTPTSSAPTASRRAGSTARRDTWWRTATAGWSTCPVSRDCVFCWARK